MDETNIKAGIRVGVANKSGLGKANIEGDKKTDARAIASTDNSTNGGGKIID